MAFNVGINVVEVDGRAAPTLPAAPVSVAGLLVRSKRGVPNAAVAIKGFADFVENFGGHVKGLYGAHAVRGFFDNGGTEAYAVRVVGAGSAASSVTLQSAAPASVLTVTAGRRGRQDPGLWGDSLSVAVIDNPRATSAIPAQVTGAAEPFALGSLPQDLVITVNGAAVTVTFTASSVRSAAAATAAEVAAHINRSTTLVRAGVTPDRRVVLASATPGSASRVAVSGALATPLGFTGGSANSDAGIAAGATRLALQSIGGISPGSYVRVETRGHTVAPSAITTITSGAAIRVQADGGALVTVTFVSADFQNASSPTGAEVTAAINRQAAGFTAELTYNGRLMILSNTYGPGSTIAVSAPASGADATASLGLTTNTPVAGARQSVTVASVSDADKLVTLTAGLASAAPANAARLRSIEFDLVVRQDGAEVERFESLSMSSAVEHSVAAVVNDPSAGSRFIAVTDLGVAGPSNAPAAGIFPLTGGADGAVPGDTHYAGDPAARSGLHALDAARIQLLACPESTSQAVAAACLSYCERRGDAMFVGAAPAGYDLEAIKAYAGLLRGKKAYGALYAPWIRVTNPLDAAGVDPLTLIPPVGHVLGAYARIADARGVWKAPAGDEAFLSNALGVELDMTDADMTDLLKSGGVNAIRAIPGSGIIVETSRTLSTDTRWLYVGTRRLFNLVKSSLRDGLRWVAQEPHTEALRRAVRLNVVTPFLLGLWRQGAFGSGPAESTFTVKCDADNNPQSEVNLGNFRLEVYFYPVKPAETIVIVVGQQESGASAGEA